MKVYGFVVLTRMDDNDVPTTHVRVFRNKSSWEQALEDLELDDNQEIDTFETDID